MGILAVWGSTGTMPYEEIIAFIPIFIAAAMTLGYDAIIGVAISIVPVGAGFASTTANPFTIGFAQTISERPMFSGESLTDYGGGKSCIMKRWHG